MVLTGALLVGVGTIVHDVLAVRADLLAAESDVSAIRAAAGTGDTSHLGALLADLQRRSAAARSGTRSAGWAAAAALPGAGASLDRVAELTAIVNDVARTAVPPLAAALQQLSGGGLVAAGQIDTAALTGVGERLRAAQITVAEARRQLSGLPHGHVLGVVRKGQEQLADGLVQLAGQLDGARRSVDVAGPLLGADGPRRYFLALQNPAEARGTGGLIGTWGIVLADRGRLSLEQTGPENQLPDLGADVASPAAELTTRWASYGSLRSLRAANLTADFPSAAAILAEQWTARTGQHLDGVIATDPVAVGRLLAATGPVTLADGTSVGGEGFAAYVLNGLYLRYPTLAEQGERTRLLVQLESAFFTRLQHVADPGALLGQLLPSVREGRVLLWSSDAALQATLAGSELGGGVPTGPGPYAGVSLDNAIGNKTDYWLGRDVRWSSSCTPTGRRTTLSVTLHDGAPASGLPDYVGGAEGVAGTHAAGTDQLLVSLMGSTGARLVSLTRDGAPAVAPQSAERGHPVWASYVTLAPGGSSTLVATWDEPRGGPVHPLGLSPLVVAPRVTVQVPRC